MCVSCAHTGELGVNVLLIILLWGHDTVLNCQISTCVPWKFIFQFCIQLISLKYYRSMSCLGSLVFAFSLSLQSTVVLFQTVSMTFCDSSFCFLRPLRQNGLPPPFPGETVPLFLYLLTCVVARLQRTPTLLFFLSAPLSTNFIVFKFAVMGTGFHDSCWLFSRSWPWFQFYASTALNRSCQIIFCASVVSL